MPEDTTTCRVRSAVRFFAHAAAHTRYLRFCAGIRKAEYCALYGCEYFLLRCFSTLLTWIVF